MADKSKFVKPFILSRGNVSVCAENNVFLAPMAGVADSAFRILCREFGAGMVYSEMISAKGVFYNGKNSLELAKCDPRESPCGIQIFGSEPEIMANAAAVFENGGAPFIDINMGCPVQKVTGNTEGSALMKQPELAGRIISAVVNAVKIPVTVKIRRGYSKGEETAVLIAKIAEDSGASAVTVHGRFREEFYSGKCDHKTIAEVKRSLNIPVIASGDVTSFSEMEKMFEDTGCEGVMIGRAALGNPYIFRECLGLDSSHRAGDLKALVRRHYELSASFKGEYTAVREMRKHIAWYLKGLPASAAAKNEICKACDAEKLLRLTDSYFDSLTEKGL